MFSCHGPYGSNVVSVHLFVHYCKVSICIVNLSLPNCHSVVIVTKISSVAFIWIDDRFDAIGIQVVKALMAWPHRCVKGRLFVVYALCITHMIHICWLFLLQFFMKLIVLGVARYGRSIFQWPVWQIGTYPLFQALLIVTLLAILHNSGATRLAHVNFIYVFIF